MDRVRAWGSRGMKGSGSKTLSIALVTLEQTVPFQRAVDGAMRADIRRQSRAMNTFLDVWSGTLLREMGPSATATHCCARASADVLGQEARTAGGNLKRGDEASGTQNRYATA